MENVENKQTEDNDDTFYPPEVFNVLGDSLGKKYKDKFLNFTKITAEEVTYIFDILKKLIAKKEGKPVIISFSNFKGGCGKTTTAVTFSQFLTNLGIKTLLIDADNMRLASRMLSLRQKYVNGYIANMTNANVSIEEINDFKDNIDPICECEKGDYGSLINTINQSIELGRYQVIVLDTPGSKEDAVRNFSIKSIGKSDLPHSLVAYIADSIVITSQATSFDRTGTINYYVELESFVNEMMFKKVRNTTLAYKVLPVRMKTIKEDYAQEFFNILEANGIERFRECFRDSDKFRNSVKDDTIETYFTVNNAPQKTIEFKNFVVELFQDLDTAMKKDEYLALKAEAESNTNTGV
jgi:cellulose biosynthesis protein BcsQ